MGMGSPPATPLRATSKRTDINNRQLSRKQLNPVALFDENFKAQLFRRNLSFTRVYLLIGFWKFYPEYRLPEFLFYGKSKEYPFDDSEAPNIRIITSVSSEYLLGLRNKYLLGFIVVVKCQSFSI